MNPLSGKELPGLAKLFASDSDVYNGTSYDVPPVVPNNILVFTRTALRIQDCKNSGHRHHRYAVIFFIEKQGLVFVEQHHYSVQEGKALLIRPFQQHYYASPAENILWLFVTFDLPGTQQLESFHQPVPVSPLMKEVLVKLLQSYQSGQARETAVLLSWILCEMGASARPSPANLSPDQKIIAEVNAYIHRHLDAPFTLQKLAEHCALSPNYLGLRFKKTMGITLGHYIHSVRMNHAMKLLILTDLTVSEIAYQSGFSSPAVFCRAFKKETGKSALNFRKSGKK